METAIREIIGQNYTHDTERHVVDVKGNWTYFVITNTNSVSSSSPFWREEAPSCGHIAPRASQQRQMAAGLGNTRH
jgi:hypothetical protein